MARTYFQVPFEDKSRAKALGALWDSEHKCWFANTPDVAGKLGQEWAVVEDVAPIVELPGEDRTFCGNTLFVDLIPTNCWFVNVRFCIDPADWRRLSLGICKRADEQCEICGAKADPEQSLHLEAHERWHFDEDSGAQVLKRIICLCSLCHRTTHYGYAQTVGQEALVREHFKRVNNVDDVAMDRHVAQAFEVWNERNAQPWTLDLSIITNAGIRLKSKMQTPASKPAQQPQANPHGGITVREIGAGDMGDYLDRLFGA